MRKYLVVGAVALLAVLWRMYNAETYAMPNLELVTATALASALLLPASRAWIAPLAVIAVTDVLIGNSMIFLFTWSAWLVTAAFALGVRRFSGKRMVLVGTGLGAVASTWFFLWTNGGVWLMGDGTMYARSWEGLVQCYVAGIPFYRNMLVGNLVLVPVVLGGIEWLRYRGWLAGSSPREASPVLTRGELDRAA